MYCKLCFKNYDQGPCHAITKSVLRIEFLVTAGLLMQPQKSAIGSYIVMLNYSMPHSLQFLKRQCQSKRLKLIRKLFCFCKDILMQSLKFAFEYKCTEY